MGTDYEINIKSCATMTLTHSDREKMLEFSNSVTNTVSIP